jgi:DNA-binding response OmpR family regulator
MNHPYLLGRRGEEGTSDMGDWSADYNTYQGPKPTESAHEPTDCILLVDDDPDLRRSMREFLESSGFRVIEARNSYDGLFAVAQFGNQIRLLITELNLLPVGGIKLAENALRLAPHLQILCMSTETDNQGLAYWMRYLNSQFLQKPFSPFELHERVHMTLGRHIQDAPISILDYQDTTTMAAIHSNNESNPMFWMEEI